MFIKQCKGKDFCNLPNKVDLDEKNYYASIKYDGHYIQIHIDNDKVRFFTSGGKEFYVNYLARRLTQFQNGIYEAEFIGNARGQLGDRTKVGILTTWRTEFAKGIESTYNNEKIVIFDYYSTEPFSKRLERLTNLKRSALCDDKIQIVAYTGSMSIADGRFYSMRVRKEGWEGIMLKHKDHRQIPGKRVNEAIKIKERPTADLLCIATKEGEGKYAGAIGSLVLTNKDATMFVSVGSGLTDTQRAKRPEEFIGKVVEIAYDSIKDTYVQPTFIGIRKDKTNKDID